MASRHLRRSLIACLRADRAAVPVLRASASAPGGEAVLEAVEEGREPEHEDVVDRRAGELVAVRLQGGEDVGGQLGDEVAAAVADPGGPACAARVEEHG